jgi:hypothetical protein
LPHCEHRSFDLGCPHEQHLQHDVQSKLHLFLDGGTGNAAKHDLYARRSARIEKRCLR